MRCAPEYLTSKLVRISAVSIRNTRNSQLLDIPLFRTASSQGTFQYRATSLWNELPPALKLSPSVTAFKRTFNMGELRDLKKDHREMNVKLNLLGVSDLIAMTAYATSSKEC
ncbi:hypothetical protein P5673_025387 [Acropora cervicornis]|uniref:Uncharacterized protein n=1 Tax=Acropora cervicornis TaxID=6130 RepID=A0AAD9Q2J2_ACRCE|nr:hypothetical protein P5673_025387 [Acropora cervicornis]